jgi:hypothetical protein
MRKLVHSEQRVSDALGQSTSTAQQHCMRTSMSPSAVLYVLVMQFTVDRISCEIVGLHQMARTNDAVSSIALLESRQGTSPFTSR